MRIGEGPRWLLALSGLGLWLAASLMPTIGGAAKQALHCRGREFTGSFDDCFNDMIPVLEMAAPVIALAFAWPFARFAFSLFAPPPELRRRRWRLATRSDPSQLWPALHLCAAAGVAWSLWRLSTYPFAGELLAFHLFWAAFGAWFASGIVAAWPDQGAV